MKSILSQSSSLPFLNQSDHFQTIYPPAPNIINHLSNANLNIPPPTFNTVLPTHLSKRTVLDDLGRPAVAFAIFGFALRNFFKSLYILRIPLVVPAPVLVPVLPPVLVTPLSAFWNFLLSFAAFRISAAAVWEYPLLKRTFLVNLSPRFA